MERQKLSEFITMLELEPTLKNIITEGTEDSLIIKWFIEQKNFKNVSVLEISDIDIPKEILEELSLIKGGNRSKVLALSIYCENKFISKQLSCIIDKDMDAILNNIQNYKCLIYTDFSCIEMYYFTIDILKRFFEIYCKKQLHISLDKFLSLMSNVLIELFLIRVANYKLEWNLEAYDFTRHITFENENINFNKEEYIKRYLNKNNKLRFLEDFNNCIEENRKSLSEEYKLYMNGHDFLNFIAYFVEKKLQKKDLKTTIVEGNPFRMGLTIDCIENYELFRQLQSRCA